MSRFATTLLSPCQLMLGLAGRLLGWCQHQHHLIVDAVGYFYTGGAARATPPKCTSGIARPSAA